MTTVEIGTPEELVAFAARVNAGETTLDARLTADIDMTGYTESQTRVGTLSRKYSATFDGNGHTISGLQGIFMSGNGAETIVKNTRFIKFNPSVTSQTTKIVLENLDIYTCIFDGIDAPKIIGKYSYVVRACCVYDSIFANIQTGGGSSTNQAAIIAYSSDIGRKDLIFKDIFTQNINTHATWFEYGALNGLVHVNGGSNMAHLKNIISIGGNRESSTRSGAINVRIGEGSTITNCYASNTITSNVEFTHIGVNDMDGQTVTATQYNQKGFYDGTGIDGITYLDWDFENTWYWDSTDNLPKLRVFRRGLPFRVKTTDGIKRTVKGFCKTTGGWKQATAAKTKTGEGWK